MKLLLIPALLLLAGPADAHEKYPDDVTDHLGLSRKPGCPLCHTTNPGRKGTANKKFAITLRALGLPPEYAPRELLAILSEVDGCRIDSDGDEIPDTEEIRSRTDPSDGPGRATTECGAGGGSGPVELALGEDVFTGTLAEHGCSQGVVRARGSELGFLVIVVLAAFFGLKSKRQKRRSSAQV